VSTVEQRINQTSTAISNEGRRSRRITIISAVTFRGQDLYEAGRSHIRNSYFTQAPTYVSPSTIKGPFTLTSPTIYLAHHPLTFRYNSNIDPESISESQSVKPAKVIHLMPADVSSIIPLHPDYSNNTEYASLMANGKFNVPTNKPIVTTIPLNFANLPDPVPARAYFNARWLNCWDKQTHYKTITDDSYRPRLVISPRI
jgi:hypothetical protein